MNFHADEWIMARVREHYNETLEHFHKDEIVGIFYQGSGNYGLDYEDSDVDTKLIVVPSFKDIAMNKQPISTTHFRANDEHIDFKDIRLYMQTFRKQNLNFLEILFTPYTIINDDYHNEWTRLVEAREEIAHMNPYQAVKSMQGIAKEKYHAMEHKYPKRMPWIEKYGYDPKQLHHLLRVQEYLNRYVVGESYEECLKPRFSDYLVEVKRGCHTLEEARDLAKSAITTIDKTCAKFFEVLKKPEENTEVRELLDDVQYNIMKIAVAKEFNE
ncbi:MAG: nucleotidyltransferase domain-containing protein [Bacteroidales bacterium]|nr:nucleotidyltransferase domain-containing protein [Bacteroidales bacterium]